MKTISLLVSRLVPLVLGLLLITNCGDNGSQDGQGSGGQGGGPGDVLDEPDPEPAVHHLSIVFDYRFDTQGFFDAPVRRAVLEEAAKRWSAGLTDDFIDLPVGVGVRLRNPENRDEYVEVTVDTPIDDIVIFVGTTTDMNGVGRGGPASYMWADTDAQEDELGLYSRIFGDDFEPAVGSISFHPSPEAGWFFDTSFDTSDDIDDRNDFLSTAVHEIGHILGFGASDAYDSLVSDGFFVGEAAVARHGSPVPEAGGHFEEGVFDDGVEPAMDISSTTGEREATVTALDLAAMQDLGYELGEL